jgi:DnaK suppressor protein
MALHGKPLDELHERLLERRVTLEGEIREDARRLREQSTPEIAGSAPDQGDLSLADLIADLDNAELTRDMQELREVEAALRRIDDQTYGACADCGRDIVLERLRAQPAATRCIDCQRMHERTHAAPGAPTL